MNSKEERMENIINNKLVSQNMKAARIRAGLTQRQLGELLGVSRQTIINWEKGTDTLKMRKFKKYAEAVGVPVSYFFGI